MSSHPENMHPAREEKRYYGLYGSARTWLIAEIARESRTLLVLCKSRSTAEDIVSDLEFFSSSTPVLFFSGWETIPFENVSPQIDVSAQRLAVLFRLLLQKPCVVVATADALLQRVPSRSFIEGLAFSLTPGQTVERDELVRAFEHCGYQSVSLVESVGEAAYHGSVIDFFPALSRFPVRVEMEGNVLAGLRTFDTETQRSVDSLPSFTVVPCRESVPFGTHPKFRQLLPQVIERVKDRGRKHETPAREIAGLTSAIKAGTQYPGMELVDPIALAPLPTLFDYLPKDSALAIDDKIGLAQSLDSQWENILERERRLSQEHYLIPHSNELFLSPDEVDGQIARYTRHFIDHLEVIDSQPLPGAAVRIRSKANTELQAKLKTKIGTGHALKPLSDFVRHLRSKDYHLGFVVGSGYRAEKLHKNLLDLGYDAQIQTCSGADWLSAARRYPLVILQGRLSSGFQLLDRKVAFVAEHEVFAERSYRRNIGLKVSLKRIMGSLALLSEGDFVVHTDYGIGAYQGLRHMEVEGNESDFLCIEYANSTLYLPVQNIGKVQKFQAAEGQVPTLDRLGSNRWIKTKQKVRESVATLAGDLIKLYAERSVIKGWRFDPRGAEDERFAEEFPYDETPDQRKAIEDTLADMALDKPMDRLICGDVGFGKTEVALRSAYKCVQHARQVAVLVPTTLLVEQHKQTFLNRFTELPVKVGAISRFYSAEDNRQTLEQLRSGELDIIIGTHRLLSHDVAFKDLGLLIIDEEHRFGVKQKERLKAMKKQVDVLTLTATPIPRTLHMSLLSLRDISVISTPPHDRRIIRTYIATHEEGLIKDAILREVHRGGQCFFVHNKVQSIDLVCAELTRLVPEARFRYAHGQMSEHELERIMAQYLKHEIDVLVTTTIIESGLDIPNANTILIDRADTFGLAQLYQLRGRVGRSNRQAYAYFLIPKTRKLGAEAQKRLKALQALDDLGLGFNLAVRDLEIRGAGNLLGKEQSGSVVAVGFELYTKILKEAIFNLKGDAVDIQESVDPEVKLGLPCYLSADYLPDISERLVLYQRFAAISSDSEADLLVDEMTDRFGPLPLEARNLCEFMRLRCLLRAYGVVRAEFNKGKLSLAFSPQAPIDPEKVITLIQKDPKRSRFAANLALTVPMAFDAIGSPAEIIPACRDLLEAISRRVA